MTKFLVLRLLAIALMVWAAVDALGLLHGAGATAAVWLLIQPVNMGSK